MLSHSVESLNVNTNADQEHNGKEPLTAYTPAVLDTLETLIAPGQRMRLSPYVEAAQFKILFNAEIDPKRRYADMKSILDRNAATLEEMAYTYVNFDQQGKKFSQSIYTDNFLRFYLAYYLTTNVCKVQLAMLDLARQGRLAGEYTIVDIGVSAGTTALAVMDFLLAWTTVCNLHGVQMPVTEIRLIGCDGNQHCLDFAAKVCTAYAHAVESRWQSVELDHAKTSFHQKIVAWAADAEWRRQDLECGTPTLPDSPMLLVASNVFNELTHKGKQNLERMLGNLSDQSMAIIIEPGDGYRTQALNEWRRQLLQICHNLTSLGPCGQEFAAKLPVACDSCWNGRRESLHEPLLHRKLREATKKKLGKGRDLDEYTNDLLSWSYHLLGSQSGFSCGVKTVAPEAIGVINAGMITSHYIGRRPNCQRVECEPNSANKNSTETIEYVKLCPGYRKNNLEFARSAGIILPRIAFGQTITFSDVNEKKLQEDVYQLLPGNETFSCEQLVTSVTRYSHFLIDHTPSFCEAVDELAYRLFGFPAMRPFQHQILEQVLFGRSILGIAATGGGKSECYILPAFILPGVTVVVSPLVSLMQDQYYN